MRTVAHLLGVEFIHDLYNRYDPRINAVRFRHTVTVWKDGIVNSYAPQTEWEELGRVVGYQYYSLDESIICATRSLYKRKRKYYYKLIRSLEHTDLESMADKDLASVLLNFQSLVLGELYVLNFVQVEHGLNTAIKQVLSEITDDQSEVDEIFVNLIGTEVPTESQREKHRLLKLSLKHRSLMTVGMYDESRAKADVRRHCAKYSHLYSAYGENPRDFCHFWDEFNALIENSHLPAWHLFPKLLSPGSRKKLVSLHNKKLSVLVPLLVCGGIFRDKNKALLGNSLKYRFAVLDEIARRGLEERRNLNYYLLSEIIDLLRMGEKLSTEVITHRAEEGVMLSRQENFSLYTTDMASLLSKDSVPTSLKGQCASRGTARGICKIVLSKDDVDKVKEGDIMVAIGTDFDLIEAMYRASAVITEEGGILSHASVVCRELKKPCCIGVHDVTRQLKDGQTIEVDATHGQITVVKD
jgi:phosphohistidine swiveling domain-containing protein